jgi:hypothetical protein
MRSCCCRSFTPIFRHPRPTTRPGVAKTGTVCGRYDCHHRDARRRAMAANSAQRARARITTDIPTTFLPAHDHRDPWNCFASTLRPGADAHWRSAPQAGQAPLTSVRARSVSQRSSTGSSGHQRSPKVTERRGPHESLAGSVDGRCSLPAADRMPQAVVAAQAASGSRPWSRPRGCRARRWRPARGRWLGRRPVARHTDRAVPRSAGPAPGRARSPLEQGIELVFEIESGILLTAVPAADGTLGHIGAQSPSIHGSAADRHGDCLAW